MRDLSPGQLDENSECPHMSQDQLTKTVGVHVYFPKKQWVSTFSSINFPPFYNSYTGRRAQPGGARLDK